MQEANEMKIELIPLPVADVDRAKAFYVEKVGFHLDHDVQPSAEMRVIKLTPPRSACSIAFGTGIANTPPGSIQGLHLVVKDIRQICQQLQERGVEVSEVVDIHEV